MPRFQPRVRKQKARARAGLPFRGSTPASTPDVSQREPTAASSSQKQKRLEKYISLKLKKDEKQELIEKISQQKTDTSLLRSSKNLGFVRETKKGNKQRQRQTTPPIDAPIDAPIKPPINPSTRFGTGLKRPLDLDESGNPWIQKRRRIKAPAIPNNHLTPLSMAMAQNESEWEGCSSSSDLEDDVGIDVEAGVNRSEKHNNQDSDSGTLDSSEEDTDGSEDISEGDGDSSESDVSEDDDDKKERLQARSTAFKDWGTKQIQDASGFTPSTNIDLTTLAPSAPSTNQKSSIGKGFQSLPLTSSTSGDRTKNIVPIVFSNARNVYNVPVTRISEIQEARSKLPIVAEEQKIMEVIQKDDVIILCGETGSGKTTQVPQFLYEAGYGDPDSANPGMIGVTQPRRVSAVTISKRVGVELGNLSGKVSHQVRFDSSTTKTTAIKFMTEGILVKEIRDDFLLRKYSIIIIDEAHERNVNTDVLMGMLSRIVPFRNARDDCKPLKLIIMSATLRITDFSENRTLFRTKLPPVVRVEGRQHRVHIHWAKKTSPEYLEDIYEKIIRGHKKLPPGSMLVFLTAQNEIEHIAKRLEQRYSSSQGHSRTKFGTQIPSKETPAEDDFDSDFEIQGTDNADNAEDEFNISEEAPEMLKMHVLPLYSQLPTAQQERVFQPPPAGSRLIVLSTNVAETGLTIPGIRYVFDCGRAKEKVFDRSTGVQSFKIDWISKASANQRTGRAGRTGPGHCYRLYSSALYEGEFAEFAKPEIQRTPLEGVVLQLRTMAIEKVVDFPFPTRPDREELLRAERTLSYLGAITDNAVTSVGEELSAYPLPPRLSRMLTYARSHDCLQFVLPMVAALAVREVFIPESHLGLLDLPGSTRYEDITSAQREELRKEYNAFHKHLSRFDRSSDALKLCAAVSEFELTKNTFPDSYRRFTPMNAMREAKQVYHQLHTLVTSLHPGALTSAISNTKSPSAEQLQSIHKAIAAGFIDQIAIRADLSPDPARLSGTTTTRTPYLTLFPSYDSRAKRAHEGDTEQSKYAFIHPSSILSSTNNPPPFIIYSHLSHASLSSEADPRTLRTRLHPLTSITSDEILDVAWGTPLVDEGKPIDRIEPLSRSDKGEERRMCWVRPSLIGERGSLGWPMPRPKKVVQKRVPVKGWVTEQIIG